MSKSYDLVAFKRDILSRKDDIQEALGGKISFNQFQSAFVAAISDNPKILSCTQQSIFKAVKKTAGLKFEPGFMGYSYLIPYGQECTFIIGYRGLVELVRRSGQLASIAAQVVYTNDKFDIDLAPSKLKHKPCLIGKRGEFKLVWAKAILKDGSVQMDFMTKEEILAIKARSKSGNNGPWKTDFNEMAKKTVLRRLCKLLPMNVDDYREIKDDEATEYREVEAQVTDDPMTTGKHETKRKELPDVKDPGTDNQADEAPADALFAQQDA